MIAADRLARAVVGAALTLGAGPAFAEETTLGAYAGLRYIRTDNVAFAEVGSQQSDDVTELSTGITFTRSQPRLDATVIYRLDDYRYQAFGDADELFHQLDVSSRISVVPSRVFLDVFGTYGQTNLDPSSTYTVSNIGINQNRGNVAVVGASPSVAIGWGSNVVGEVRQSYAKVNYEDPVAMDSSMHGSSFDLGNSLVREGVTWSTVYLDEKYDYDQAGDIELELFQAEIGRWFGGSRLYTIQGVEPDYEKQAQTREFTGGLDSHYWYVGLEWRPNELTDLNVAVGDRGYGGSKRIQLNRRFSAGTLSFGYYDEPTSSLREQLKSVRGVGELAPIDNPNGAVPDVIYVAERYDLAFYLERPKTSAGFREYSERRFNVNDDVNESEAREKVRGTELTFDWQFHVRSSLSVSAQAIRRQSAITLIDDDSRYFTVTLNRRLAKSTDASLSFTRQRSETFSGSVSNSPYRQSTVILGIQRLFGEVSGGAVQRFRGYANAGISR